MILTPQTEGKNYIEHKVCCYNCKYAYLDYEDTWCHNPKDLENELYPLRVENHGVCDWFEKNEGEER